jgi:hypothetical protein
LKLWIDANDSSLENETVVFIISAVFSDGSINIDAKLNLLIVDLNRSKTFTILKSEN